MRRLGLVAVVSAIVCGGASAATVDPKPLVLQASDLPSGYSVNNEGYMTNRDAASGSSVVPIPVTKLTKWGRLTGYERSFERDNSTATSNGGFLSNASVYRSSGGAKSAAAHLFTRFPSRSQWLTFVPKTLPMAHSIGDGSRMYQFPTSRGVATIFVVWRSGRVLGLLGLEATSGVTPARAMLYANKMHRRIAGLS